MPKRNRGVTVAIHSTGAGQGSTLCIYSKNRKTVKLYKSITGVPANLVVRRYDSTQSLQAHMLKGIELYGALRAVDYGAPNYSSRIYIKKLKVNQYVACVPLNQGSRRHGFTGSYWNRRLCTSLVDAKRYRSAAYLDRLLYP